MVECTFFFHIGISANYPLLKIMITASSKLSVINDVLPATLSHTILHYRLALFQQDTLLLQQA